MDKILTIVIPTYNMEKYLDKCLTSLIVDDADLMKRLEVLVVIDGATDRSSEIAHTYQDRFPDTFRVIDKENGNYGSCVNRGLKEAEGKYIKILDADDSFDTANFKEFLKFLLTVDVDCVISDMVYVDENGKELSVKRYKFEERTSFSLDTLCTEIDKLTMHNICYKTGNVRAIGYHQTEGLSYTDQEWVCLPMSNVKTIHYCPYIVYRYLTNRCGQTTDMHIREKKFWQEIKVIKGIMDKSQSKTLIITEKGKKYVNAYLNRYIRSLYWLVLMKFRSYDNNKLMISFDEYVKSYNEDLYEDVDKKNTVCAVFHYVNYWRRNYNPYTPYLRFLRRLKKLISGLRQEFLIVKAK